MKIALIVIVGLVSMSPAFAGQGGNGKTMSGGNMGAAGNVRVAGGEGNRSGGSTGFVPDLGRCRSTGRCAGGVSN